MWVQVSGQQVAHVGIGESRQPGSFSGSGFGHLQVLLSLTAAPVGLVLGSEWRGGILLWAP